MLSGFGAAQDDHDSGTLELFLSCGFQTAACQVWILDNDDQEVATGEPGEICARAPHVYGRKAPATPCTTLLCI